MGPKKSNKARFVASFCFVFLDTHSRAFALADQELTPLHLLHKLRWVTLGYHYNWTTQEYENGKCTEFPRELAGMMEYVAKHMGICDFKAEAAIVNYYHVVCLIWNKKKKQTQK